MPLSTENLQRAWRDFKVYKDPNARADLIDHYSYLVKITAGRLVANLSGSLERDDLVSAGVVGLIKSVDQFDPTRDVKFETYAIALIRGAILEMLRDSDWVPRSMRDKMKAIARAQQELDGEPETEATPREIADRAGLTEQEVSHLLTRMGKTTVYSLDDVVGGTGDDGDDSIHFVEMLVDEESTPAGEAEGKEIRRILADALDHLPDRERLVVALYYYEGLTFKEIGRVLGVSESRVYQLHTQATSRLRKFMADQGAINAA